MYRRRRSKNETVLVCDYLNRRRHFLIFLNCSKIKSKKQVDYILMVLAYLVAYLTREYVISYVYLLYMSMQLQFNFYYLAKHARAHSFALIFAFIKILKKCSLFQKYKTTHTHKEKSPRDEMKSFLCVAMLRIHNDGTSLFLQLIFP